MDQQPLKPQPSDFQTAGEVSSKPNAATPHPYPDINEDAPVLSRSGTGAQSFSALQRHFGLLPATALNVSMIVGAGVFVTIPLMLGILPGPYALLGWVAAGALMLVDGLIWSELGAALPGSGGSYLYLLEAYGRQRWGRLMAFLFIWQFLISGPLEIGSGLIAIAVFSSGLHPDFKAFNQEWTKTLVLSQQADLAMTISPSRVGAFVVGLVILALLYRRMASLKWMTITVWVGVLATIVWILVEGLLRFDRTIAFDFSGSAVTERSDVLAGLGGAMALAMYSYLGYYNVCYIGEEVRDPGRTIPRSILLSSVLVCVLFVGIQMALLGVISWRDVPTQSPEVDTYNLPAEFMRKAHGDWAATLITLCLIWSCIGSAFAGLLGYSRIPFAAARHGHFFAAFGQVHERHRIPHVALLFVGGLTLFWTFFDLQNVINALIVTRILEQFIGQIVAVILLRHLQPHRPRPYKMFLYPLPCGLALVGWLFMYLSAPWVFILLGLATLFAGGFVFLLWTYWTRQWPFAPQGQKT
jgi:amino acid transporter